MKTEILRVLIALLWLALCVLAPWGTWTLLRPDWTITRIFVLFVCTFEVLCISVGSAGLWMLTED